MTEHVVTLSLFLITEYFVGFINFFKFFLSGFFLMVKRSDVRELDMSVDQALTYVISMGAVAPDANAQTEPVAPTPSLPTKRN